LLLASERIAIASERVMLRCLVRFYCVLKAKFEYSSNGTNFSAGVGDTLNKIRLI